MALVGVHNSDCGIRDHSVHGTSWLGLVHPDSVVMSGIDGGAHFTAITAVVAPTASYERSGLT